MIEVLLAAATFCTCSEIPTDGMLYSSHGIVKHEEFSENVSMSYRTLISIFLIYSQMKKHLGLMRFCLFSPKKTPNNAVSSQSSVVLIDLTVIKNNEYN